MIPSLGRIVIFKSHEDLDYAAIIVRCDKNEETAPVNLSLFSRDTNGSSLIKQCLQGTGKGQWSEPKRV